MKTNYKKARLEFDKLPVDKPQSFWENVLWTDEPKMELFAKKHQLYVQTEILSISRKEDSPYCETWRKLCYVLGLLSCVQS